MPKGEAKPKDERVKETITILKKMMELGISKMDPSFIDLKQKMTNWVETGNAWNGKIQFKHYNRVAIINLPESGRFAATIEFNICK